MWATYNDTSPAAVSLNAGKAFNIFFYLFLTLESFGFSNKFVTWIQLLYTHPKAAMWTNGLVLPWFDLGRETRQGNRISQGLLALALKPLATAIRLELSIPGIWIGQSIHKLLLYADDILMFFSEPEHSLPTLFKIINTFSHRSGYKVNWLKSETLQLNSHCLRTMFQRGNLSWPSNGIKYQHCTFVESIWSRYSKMAPLFLSVREKANVLKMTHAPKFNYILQELPARIPLKYFKLFDQLCNRFLRKASTQDLIYTDYKGW